MKQRKCLYFQKNIHLGLEPPIFLSCNPLKVYWEGSTSDTYTNVLSVIRTISSFFGKYGMCGLSYGRLWVGGEVILW